MDIYSGPETGTHIGLKLALQKVKKDEKSTKFSSYLFSNRAYLRSVIDKSNYSGISIESCTRSKDQGIHGQLWGYQDYKADVPDHPVKESHRKVHVCHEN